MHTRIGIAAAAAVLLGLSSQTGLAQDGCGGIEFSSEITNRFPNAASACLDVVERDGEEYAHFQSRIVRVRGNEVDVEFMLPDGSYGRTVTFSPPADARVRIQGRSYRYRELERGQELDVYLPPDLWAFAVHEDPAADFATAETVSTVALADPPQQTAAVLPSTATPLPLLGLLGVVLTALGAAMAGLRIRLLRKR